MSISRKYRLKNHYNQACVLTKIKLQAAIFGKFCCQIQKLKIIQKKICITIAVTVKIFFGIGGNIFHGMTLQKKITHLIIGLKKCEKIFKLEAE